MGSFRRSLVMLGIVGGLAACGEPRETGVRLRFSYEPGDTLRYLYHSSGSATTPDSTAPSGTRVSPYEREIRIDEVATEITPRGHYVLTLTYYLPADSTGRKPVPDRITINLEVTPQGRIVAVTGVETAKPLFGDLDFQSYAEQTQPVFPDRPLTLGDSWTQEVKVVAPGTAPVVTSSTYVLEQLTTEDGEATAVIGYEGDIYLPVVYAESDSAGDRPRSVEERIRMRGAIYFAHERGVVRRVEERAEATLTRIHFVDREPVRRELRITEESLLRLIEP
ncbi:MAG: hypothetical protein ABR559_05765 [Gemmatimonadota bacterium]